MAKNIKFNGNIFSNVPRVQFLQQNNSWVGFDDTSDATAEAKDIAQNKIAYVNGQKIIGTAVEKSTVIEALNVTENGTYIAINGVDGYNPVNVNIETIQIEEKDVNFYDYEGTLLYSYTVNEALSLTSLPANPNHEGLIAQGWNYTLAQIKTQCNEVGKCDIGQMYITDNGETRLYITINSDTLNNTDFGVGFKSSVSNNVTINWGDGSSPEIKGSTSLNSYYHTYETAGDYIITLKVNSGTIQFGGSNNTSVTSGTSIFGSRTKTYLWNRLKAVEIGTNVTSIKDSAFMSCTGLKTITIPSSVTGENGYSFYYCFSLASIVLPTGFSKLGGYSFMYCVKLKSISLPYGILSINGTNIFSYCDLLKRVIFPYSVTGTFSNRTFYFCHNLECVRVPNGVTKFQDYIFYSNISLTDLNIPKVTSFGTYAISYCCSLKTIVISEGTTSIPSYMCNGCFSLQKVVIPSTVTSISSYAFDGDLGIKEFHLKSTTPPSLSTTGFSVQSYTKIYVPEAALNTYKTASGWKNFSSYIFAEEEL